MDTKTEQIAAPIIEVIKETNRHMEELYRQAGEGRIVVDGLKSARDISIALTEALIEVQQSKNKSWID